MPLTNDPTIQDAEALLKRAGLFQQGQNTQAQIREAEQQQTALQQRLVQCDSAEKKYEAVVTTLKQQIQTIREILDEFSVDTLGAANQPAAYENLIALRLKHDELVQAIADITAEIHSEQAQQKRLQTEKQKAEASATRELRQLKAATTAAKAAIDEFDALFAEDDCQNMEQDIASFQF